MDNGFDTTPKAKSYFRMEDHRDLCCIMKMAISTGEDDRALVARYDMNTAM